MRQRNHELHPHGGGWLREIVFGLNDGLVTTLVFVLAISAIAHPQIVLVALGELFAGGISMGLGAYLSARTEQAIVRQRIATERYEITHEPDWAIEPLLRAEPKVNASFKFAERCNDTELILTP